MRHYRHARYRMENARADIFYQKSTEVSPLSRKAPFQMKAIRNASPGMQAAGRWLA
jgi:hypothetical protein